MPILCRFARINEHQLHPVAICPQVKLFASELRTIVHLNLCWQAVFLSSSLQQACHSVAAQAGIHFLT
jgi:hypothetical protein